MVDLTTLYRIEGADFADTAGPKTMTAVGGPVIVEVEVGDGECGQLFKRRALKAVGTAKPRPVGAIVAELQGVRAYLTAGRLVLTTADRDL